MQHSILVLLVLQEAVQDQAAESHTDTGQDLWRPNIQCLQWQAAQSTVLSHDVPLVLVAVASGMLITLSSMTMNSMRCFVYEPDKCHLCRFGKQLCLPRAEHILFWTPQSLQLPLRPQSRSMHAC